MFFSFHTTWLCHFFTKTANKIAAKVVPTLTLKYLFTNPVVWMVVCHFFSFSSLFRDRRSTQVSLQTRGMRGSVLSPTDIYILFAMYFWVREFDIVIKLHWITIHTKCKNFEAIYDRHHPLPSPEILHRKCIPPPKVNISEFHNNNEVDFCK